MEDAESSVATVQPGSKHENHSGELPIGAIMANGNTEIKLDQRVMH